MHYAQTLAGWCRNLVENWDECVAEVGEGTARVWGLYMAGSRLGFERNEIQLHQVLAVRDRPTTARDGFPLRHDVVTAAALTRSRGRTSLAGEHPGQAVRRAASLRREQLSPHLVRLTLGGPTAWPASSRPASPTSGSGWSCPGSSRAATTRCARWDGGELVLDVVVHEVGLVTEWAARDCVGDTRHGHRAQGLVRDARRRRAGCCWSAT